MVGLRGDGESPILLQLYFESGQQDDPEADDDDGGGEGQEKEEEKEEEERKGRADPRFECKYGIVVAHQSLTFLEFRLIIFTVAAHMWLIVIKISCDEVAPSPRTQ